MAHPINEAELFVSIIEQQRNGALTEVARAAASIAVLEKLLEEAKASSGAPEA